MSNTTTTLVEAIVSAQGLGEVSVASADLNAHQTDWWPIATKRKLEHLPLASPIAVFYPKSTDEVANILGFANSRGIAIVPYGLGSGVVGGAMAIENCVTIDTSHMKEILAVDEVSMLVTVQAGLCGSDLEAYLNERGFTAGHYPQSLSLSTVGGWIATRASGTFSTKFGNIENLVKGLVAVAGNGRKIVLKPSPRKSAGPDIGEILLGSEGTLAVICEVSLTIFPLVKDRPIAAYSFLDVATGLGAIRGLAQSDFCPALVRLNDASGSQKFRSFKGVEAGECVLVLSWDGSREVVAISRALTDSFLLANGGRTLDPAVASHWFDNRFDVSHLEEAIASPGKIADTTEVACLWRDAVTLHTALTRLFIEHGIDATCHFSHVYHTGTSLYWTYQFSDTDLSSLQKRYFSIWDNLMNVTLEHDGAISHHHGLGRVRAKWLNIASPSSTHILEGLKQTLDPQYLLNPGGLGLNKP